MAVYANSFVITNNPVETRIIFRQIMPVMDENGNEKTNIDDNGEKIGEAEITDLADIVMSPALAKKMIEAIAGAQPEGTENE